MAPGGGKNLQEDMDRQGRGGMDRQGSIPPYIFIGRGSCPKKPSVTAPKSHFAVLFFP